MASQEEKESAWVRKTTTILCSRQNVSAAASSPRSICSSNSCRDGSASIVSSCSEWEWCVTTKEEDEVKSGAACMVLIGCCVCVIMGRDACFDELAVVLGHWWSQPATHLWSHGTSFCWVSVLRAIAHANIIFTLLHYKCLYIYFFQNLCPTSI